MKHELVAAVDMGSNSFRLQVGQVHGNQIYELDGLREPVRLAAGLGAGKMLDAASQKRALEALAKFGERLRGFEFEQVRAVATDTLRVARNGGEFLLKAEEALGFPIEVLSGREEARLIYLGVAHTLHDPLTQQLVVDIGGGSTECIIGKNFKPIQLESLYMGCVGFSLRFFPDGRVTKRSFRAAELAAQGELERISNAYRAVGWDMAIGSSGTARAIAELLEFNGLSAGGITPEGMERICAQLIAAGSVKKLPYQGIRPDRVPVLAGGMAIMSAVFKALRIRHMVISDGALRLGVLYDLLGRYHHEDLREATVHHFMQRYQIDPRQAERVGATALLLLQQVLPAAAASDNAEARILSRAARLHELGISVAHAGYHKHSAYILSNADMPGFSRQEQERLARIVLAHRGKLERLNPAPADGAEWLLAFCLRLAVLLHRARDNAPLPPLALHANAYRYQLVVDADWLDASPLTAAALHDEALQWASLGVTLKIKTQS